MNKTFPSLYSRDTLGNIRIWHMEQQDNKYRVVSGLKDGEKVTSEWTIANTKNEGKKNATSAVEQATKEIEAKYKKQKKTGYFEDISKIDTVQYIEPILAKSYKDYVDEVIFENGEWGAQTKFNGICCIATKNGCFSRKGEKFLSVGHIEESLGPFFEKNPESFLHGELFNDNYREKLNEIVKLCRKTVNITSGDIKNSKNLIQFYIYDGCIKEAMLDQSKPYFERKKWIDENIVNCFKHCVKVDTIIIKHKTHLDELFSERIARGDEGLILRKMDMRYSHKRDKNLLKYKPVDSDEMLILNIKEGSGNWSGKAKTIEVKTKNGNIFEATFKGDMQAAEKFLKEKTKWIGKEVTITFFGYTGLGCPQYAQLDINNCDRLD
jgi:ATP-dependent DNA ligase